jgi:DNA repair exonuclease SbcCD nuclease subunit
MKAVLVTDTHLGYKGSSKKWLSLTSDLFKTIADYCLTQNIKKIIHLGDFFDNRYHINVLTMNESFKILKMLEDNGIEIFIIKGNHDQYYKNDQSIHSLVMFNNHSNVTIVDEIMEFDHEILCPWDQMPEPTTKTVMGHYEINGISPHRNSPEMTNAPFKISDFSGFKQVLSGHYHSKSINSNITYLGSAFPMNFNDVNEQRGFYHYKDGEILKFIEFSDAPKFKVITSESPLIEDDIKNNICKLVFTKKYKTQIETDLIEKIKSFNPQELFIDFNLEKMYDTTNDSSNAPVTGTNKEIIQHYIDNIHTIKEGMDKKTLKKYLNHVESSVNDL